MADAFDEDEWNDTVEALSRAIRDLHRDRDDREHVEVIQNILDESPEDETRGRALFPVIMTALRDSDPENPEGIRAMLSPLSTEAMRRLIQHDPEASDIQDENGYLLLHYACEYNAPEEVIELLIDQNPGALLVPCNHMQFRGMLPLHVACSFAVSSVEIVSTLLTHCPEAAREPNRDGLLPLHLALNYCMSEDVIRCLLDYYPEAVRVADNDGCLPLHCCDYWDDDETTAIVEFLIENYPEAVQSTDNEGMLPMHYACQRGMSVNIIRLLMDRYQGEATHVSGLRVADNGGKIPLHYAVKGATIEMVQLLVERDPEGVRVRDNAGRLALHEACNNVNPSSHEMIHLLLELDPFTILETCRYGTALQLAFDTRYGVHTLETMMFLVRKQDEALQATNEGFQHVVETYGLPDLVAAKIRGYILLPRLWRPTDEDLRGANSDVESNAGSEFDSYFSSDAESVVSDVS